MLQGKIDFVDYNVFCDGVLQNTGIQDDGKARFLARAAVIEVAKRTKLLERLDSIPYRCGEHLYDVCALPNEVIYNIDNVMLPHSCLHINSWTFMLPNRLIINDVYDEPCNDRITVYYRAIPSTDSEDCDKRLLDFGYDAVINLASARFFISNANKEQKSSASYFMKLYEDEIRRLQSRVAQGFKAQFMRRAPIRFI